MTISVGDGMEHAGEPPDDGEAVPRSGRARAKGKSEWTGIEINIYFPS